MSKENENLFKEMVEGIEPVEFNYRNKWMIKVGLKPDKLNANDQDALDSRNNKQIAGVLVKCVDYWEMKRKADKEYTPMNNGYAPSVEFFTEGDFPLPLLTEIGVKLLDLTMDTSGKKKLKTTSK